MKRNKNEQERKWQKVTGMDGFVTGLKLCCCVILFMLFVLPPDVMAARERFVLDFDDRYMSSIKGESATLYLKKILRQQYPGIDVTDFRLHKVVLFAKSKKGKGRVQLRVGPEFSSFYRVGGHSRNFFHHKRRSFDRIIIANPYRSSRGPWQLNLHGNFKVRKVVLIVEERVRHHHGWWSHGRRDHFSKLRW